MYLFFLALAVHIEHEEALLHRLKNGDSSALGELYDAYSSIIYRLILRIVHDTGVAEDLVQETFFKLWKRASLLDEGVSSIGPWVVTIARKRALHYLASTLNTLGSRAAHLGSIEHIQEFAAID